VLQQMAVLTLAYDGACRVHSVAEGVTRCCWRSPTSSCYTAMDVVTSPQGQVRATRSALDTATAHWMCSCQCWIPNQAAADTAKKLLGPLLQASSAAYRTA
jgi:hypothetical protein